jgi:peptide/nickel transport system permease protein
LLDGLFTSLAAVTITFFALRLAGGDPLASLLSQGLATPAQIEELRISLGLDQSILLQYLDFLKSVIQGDLGHSLYTSRPVVTIILEQIPHTIQLASLSLAFAIMIGLFIGVAAGWQRLSIKSRVAEFIANLSTSLPVSFTGILAIYFVTRVIQWNTFGAIISSSRLLLLPSLILGFASGGAIARVIQSGLEASLREPYMLSARARGIARFRRLLWFALRPVLPPAISLIALEAAFLFAGTVVTETVFSRPGLGRLLVSSILQGDFPIVQGLVVLAAFLYTITHAIADILAMLIDPRLDSTP